MPVPLHFPPDRSCFHLPLTTPNQPFPLAVPVPELVWQALELCPVLTVSQALELHPILTGRPPTASRAWTHFTFLLVW